MNVKVDELSGKCFTIEDVMSYSNIEITNVNDNKPPMRVVTTKIVIFCIIAALVASLFII
jgi:hypothetical protein